MSSDQVPVRSLEMRQGDEVALEFEGLGSAGYRWREQISGDVNVVTVSWHLGPTLRPPLSAGSSAPETAVIHAQEAGEVEIAFLQLRPWEEDATPLHIERVRVRVIGSITK